MLMVSGFGRITLVNSKLERQFGYGRAVLLGRSVDVLVPERFRPVFPGQNSCFFRTPQSDVAIGDRELFGLRADGSEFPVELGLNPVGTTEGMAVLCAVIDISERKRVEAERASLNRRLMESSRRVGMADVATSVLHNVGNVLNSVNTSATMLGHALDGKLSGDVTAVASLMTTLDCSRDDSAHRIHQVGQFIGQLAEELGRREASARAELERLMQHVEHVKQVVIRQQALAKPGGLVEQSDLAELIEQALSMEVASYAPLKIEVERRLAPVGPVMVDRHQVLQILTNLLVNARNALLVMPEDARRVVVELVEEPMPAGVIRIAVEDNGHGIAAEHLERVFEFGFTTREAGHGFGLHSAAVAARTMGGRLLVASDGPGRGARFVLEMPSQALRAVSEDAS
jgi:PAS domain S-box-containing protein